MESKAIYKKGEIRDSNSVLSDNINSLHSILNSAAMMFHLAKWLSVLLETMLYILFVVTVYFYLSLPAHIEVFFPAGKDPSFIVGLDFERYDEMILFLRSLLLVLTVPIFGFALMLRRFRKKDQLIFEAFGAVIHLKHNFEKAKINLQ